MAESSATKFKRWAPDGQGKSRARLPDIAGGSTTTATVLARSIFREGVKMVSAGHNPMEIKRGIDAAVVGKLVDNLKSRSKPTKDLEIASSPKRSAPTATP